MAGRDPLGAYEQSITIKYFKTFWTITAIFVPLILLASGGLADGFGVYNLFRGDPALITDRNGLFAHPPVLWTVALLDTAYFILLFLKQYRYGTPEWMNVLVFSVVILTIYSACLIIAVFGIELLPEAILSVFVIYIPMILIFPTIISTYTEVLIDASVDEATKHRKYVFSLILAAAVLFLILYYSVYKLIPSSSGGPIAWLPVLIIFILLFGYLHEYLPSQWNWFPSVAIVLLIFKAGTWQTYKYEFPGILSVKGNNAYNEPVDLDKAAPGRPAEAIEPVAALDAWLARASQSGDAKPKFVIVAASGGGYRAAFWTAALLDTIAGQSGKDGGLPGLSSRIGLLTGASGGMVGSAYFGAGAGRGKSPLPVVEQIQSDVSSSPINGSFPHAADFRLATVDSLSAVVWQLGSGDIWHIFSPFKHYSDRGRALEEQWLKLDLSFADYNRQVASGDSPSIVFSPVLVETGQPLIISNLDLRGTKLIEGAHSADFFGLFPASMKTFKLKTAVRMNASFPYVSPAVDLPTIPKRRVVDAGFYDNYGVSTAIAYLSTPKIRDWLLKYTSGVIVLQIRAYPLEEHGTGGGSQDWRSFVKMPDWAMSPVETLLSSRRSAMIDRNDQEINLIQAMYDAPRPADKQGHFVETVIFETDAQASLSWYLTQEELKSLKVQAAHPNPGPDGKDPFDRLKSLWRGDASEASAGVIH